MSPDKETEETNVVANGQSSAKTNDISSLKGTKESCEKKSNGSAKVEARKLSAEDSKDVKDKQICTGKQTLKPDTSVNEVSATSATKCFGKEQNVVEIKKETEPDLKIHVAKKPNDVARQLNFNSDDKMEPTFPVLTTPIKIEEIKIEKAVKTKTEMSSESKKMIETLIMPSPSQKILNAAISLGQTSTSTATTNHATNSHQSHNSTATTTSTSHSTTSTSSHSATSSRRSSSGSSSHTHHHHHKSSLSSSSSSSTKHNLNSATSSSSSSSSSRSRECSRCYKRSKIRRASVGTQSTKHPPMANTTRTSRNNSRVPVGLEHLKYGQYFEVEVYPNGGASVVHLYQDEIQSLSPDEMEELVNEFFDICFAEDEEGYAHHVMGIVHDAAKYLPDLLEHMAENYSTLTVKAGVLGRNSDIETCTMSQYYEQVNLPRQSYWQNLFKDMSAQFSFF